MSGSGGGNFGGGGMPEPNDCKNFNSRGLVNSPDPTVLATISKNDVLDITLSGSAGPILAITSNGDTLGSVLITKMAGLLECLAEGHQFQGRVISLSGAQCELLITAK